MLYCLNMYCPPMYCLSTNRRSTWRYCLATNMLALLLMPPPSAGAAVVLPYARHWMRLLAPGSNMLQVGASALLCCAVVYCLLPGVVR